jgi:hypothetical protein
MSLLPFDLPTVNRPHQTLEVKLNFPHQPVKSEKEKAARGGLP